MTDPVLEVTNLRKYFKRSSLMDSILPNRETEVVSAVDDVSFSVSEGESIGVIGESGCGKTTLLKTLMGLHEITEGEISLEGKPTSEFSKKDWKEYRRKVQFIFQDPFNALNPKKTVRDALLEPLKIHNITDREMRIREALDKAELRPPEKFLDQRPKHLSGGEKQRVAIARVLTLEPEVILADEPVSMLDVSTQASILKLLSRLVDETGISMVYISHDLSTVSYVCDVLKIMYLGRFIESGPTKMVIDEPKHPYSKALIQAIPVPDPHTNRERTTMEGSPRDPIGLEEGCRFRDRCPERMEICDKTPNSVVPDGEGSSKGREVACHLYYDHTKTHSR